jgi:hypothetical protein
MLKSTSIPTHPGLSNGQTTTEPSHTIRKFRVGDNIQISKEAWGKLFPIYGTAFSFFFLGSLPHVDGSRTILLLLDLGGATRQLQYNVGPELPAEIALRGVSFGVLSISEQGNAIELNVP